MDRDSASLVDEVKAAIAPARGLNPDDPRAIRSERIRAARSRFLPYVIAGGAIACAYLGALVTSKDDLAAVVGAAVSAGVVAGMSVGWALLALYRRWVERRTPGRRRVDLAIVLLTLPAYALAGWVSAWVGWIVAVNRARPTPEPGHPDAWGLLVFAAVVIYPLSYVFALRDRDRPRGFISALAATNSEVSGGVRSYLVLGDFLIGFAWFTVGLVAAFGLVIGVQAMFPDFEIAGAVGSWLTAAVFFGVWIGLTVAGTVWTVRLVHRVRSRGS